MDAKTALRKAVTACLLFVLAHLIPNAWRAVRIAATNHRTLGFLYYSSATEVTAPRGWKLDARGGELLLKAWFTVVGSRFTAIVHIGPASDVGERGVMWPSGGDDNPPWLEHAEQDFAEKAAETEALKREFMDAARGFGVSAN